jgi:hypothetical protein
LSWFEQPTSTVARVAAVPAMIRTSRFIERLLVCVVDVTPNHTAAAGFMDP